MMKRFEIVSGKKIFDLLAFLKIRPADIVHNNKCIFSLLVNNGHYNEINNKRHSVLGLFRNRFGFQIRKIFSI